MEIDLGAAIAAGLVATAAMTAVLYMGIGMMPMQMTMNLLYMEGSMVVAQRTQAFLLGAMMHTMMGVAFAVLHVALYRAFGIESGLAVWGLAIGIGHAALIGAIGMPMVGAIHPLVRSGRLIAPGFMLTSHPMGTVVGFFMVHAIFGAVTGLVYESLL